MMYQVVVSGSFLNRDRSCVVGNHHRLIFNCIFAIKGGGSVVVWTVAPGNFQAVGRVCEMLVVGLVTYLC